MSNTGVLIIQRRCLLKTTGPWGQIVLLTLLFGGYRRANCLTEVPFDGYWDANNGKWPANYITDEPFLEGCGGKGGCCGTKCITEVPLKVTGG